MLNASVQMQKTSEAYVAGAASEPKPRISDLISTIARLSQVLSEETDALAKLQIRKASDLQDEKVRLSVQLQKYKAYYDKFPGELDALYPNDREDLHMVVNVFQNILKQNERRLLVSREMNRKMIEVIRQSVKEATAGNQLYNPRGRKDFMPVDRVNVAINEII